MKTGFSRLAIIIICVAILFSEQILCNPSENGHNDNLGNEQFLYENQTPIMFVSICHSGQLNSILIIAEKVSRLTNKKVLFATTSECEKRVQSYSQFVEFIPISGKSFTDEDIQFMNELSSGINPHETSRLSAMILSKIEIFLNPLMEIIPKYKPRLMVIDGLSFGAMVAAKQFKVPYVLNIPFLVSLITNYLPTYYPWYGSGLSINDMTLWNRFYNIAYYTQIFIHSVLNFAKILNRLKRLGISWNPDVGIKQSNAIIGHSLPGLEYPSLIPPNFHFVGAIIPENSTHQDRIMKIGTIRGSKEASPEQVQNWLSTHSNVVLINMGTLASFTKSQIYQVIEGLGQNNVLWKISSDRDNLDEVIDIPKNFLVVSWLPSQIEVLRHPNISIFVTHGGGNAFSEGVYFAKPMLVIPFWVDTLDIATRIEDARIGLKMDRNFNSIELRSKVKRLMDPMEGFRKNIILWSRRMKEAGGAQRAAEIILDVSRFEIAPLPSYVFSDPHWPLIDFLKITLSIIVLGISISLFKIILSTVRFCHSTLSHKRLKYKET